MCKPSALICLSRPALVFILFYPSIFQHSSSFLLNANPVVWRPTHGSDSVSCASKFSLEMLGCGQLRWEGLGLLPHFKQFTLKTSCVDSRWGLWKWVVANLAGFSVPWWQCWMDQEPFTIPTTDGFALYWPFPPGLAGVRCHLPSPARNLLQPLCPFPLPPSFLSHST